VSLSSSQDNKKAALAFLADIRDRKTPKEDPYDEERDGKLVFKKPAAVSSSKSKSNNKSKKSSDKQGVEITHLEHDWKEELEAKAEAKIVDASIHAQNKETSENTTFAKKTRRKNIRKRVESDDE
jgi:hypothetical protein